MHDNILVDYRNNEKLNQKYQIADRRVTFAEVFHKESAHAINFNCITTEVKYIIMSHNNYIILIKLIIAF